jgi:hypothetical protein
MSQQRTPSRPGRQSHSSVTTATCPPEETEPHHITALSPVTLVTLVENRSKGTFGLTLPPNDASFSLYAAFSSHCCHSSELPVALAARAEPHHITAVSPVTLVTLVENCSKGKFGLTLPLNDASFSLYAVLSSHCCHSSELPIALAARATHQSRQPHAPPKKQSHISLETEPHQPWSTTETRLLPFSLTIMTTTTVC